MAPVFDAAGRCLLNEQLGNSTTWHAPGRPPFELDDQGGTVFEALQAPGIRMTETDWMRRGLPADE